MTALSSRAVRLVLTGWSAMAVFMGVLPQTIASDGKESARQTIAVIASDFKDSQGKQFPIEVSFDAGELAGIRFQGASIPLREVDEKGTVLWKVKTLGTEFVVFKIRRGWPKNPKAKEMDPAIASESSKLDGSGGYLTLSYLAEGGIFSNEYKHLKFKVQCDGASKCQLISEDGKEFDRLFAYARENQRGLKEVVPVTRSRFAELIRDRISSIELPSVANAMFKHTGWDGVALAAASLQESFGNEELREGFAGSAK